MIETYKILREVNKPIFVGTVPETVAPTEVQPWESRFQDEGDARKEIVEISMVGPVGL